MTKKDFQLIAATIAAAYASGAPTVSAGYIAAKFADALSATNPLFKRDLFIQAATGQVSVTARKARDIAVTLPRATGPRTHPTPSIRVGN